MKPTFLSFVFAACVLATLLGAVSASPILQLSYNDSLVPRGGLGVDVGQPDLASRYDVLIDEDAMLSPRGIPEDQSTPGSKQLAKEAPTASGRDRAALSGGEKETSQDPNRKRPNADGLPTGETSLMNNFGVMADIAGHPTRVQTDRFRQGPTLRDGTDTFNFRRSDPPGSYHFGSPRRSRARESYYPSYSRFPQDTGSVIVGVDHRGGIVDTHFFPVTSHTIHRQNSYYPSSSRSTQDPVIVGVDHRGRIVDKNFFPVTSHPIHRQNSPTDPSQTPGSDGAPASGSQAPNTSRSHSASSAGSNVPSSPSGGSGGHDIPEVKKGETLTNNFGGTNGGPS